MAFDWNELKAFLHRLGVEMEGGDLSMTAPPKEPMMTFLQLSHGHDAVYRIDLFETGPELLVLVPTNATALRFHVYQVQWSEGEALVSVMKSSSQGSDDGAVNRDSPAWHLLLSIVEVMKGLFWIGQDTSHFAPQITVHKLL